MVNFILATPQGTMDLQKALDEERGIIPRSLSQHTPPPKLRQPIQPPNSNDSGLDSLVKQMNKVKVKASSPEKVKENYITRNGRIIKQPDRYKS